MNIVSIIIVTLILAVDIYLFGSLMKNKIILVGKNPMAAIMQTIIAFFVVVVVASKNFTTVNILIMFGAAFYLLFGNGNGISEKGIVCGSRLIPWDKISKFTIKDEKESKILSYYVRDIERKIIFKKEDEQALNKGLQPIAEKTNQKLGRTSSKSNKKNKK